MGTMASQNTSLSIVYLDSNAENATIWWCHHDNEQRYFSYYTSSIASEWLGHIKYFP